MSFYHVSSSTYSPRSTYGNIIVDSAKFKLICNEYVDQDVVVVQIKEIE